MEEKTNVKTIASKSKKSSAKTKNKKENKQVNKSKVSKKSQKINKADEIKTSDVNNQIEIIEQKQDVLKSESVQEEKVEKPLLEDLQKKKHLKEQKAKTKKVKSKEQRLANQKSESEKKTIDKKKLTIIISIAIAAVAIVVSFICIIVVATKPATISTIDVASANKTTGYKAFDIFDDDGLTLKATYSDGTISIIEDGWTVSYVSINGDNETYHGDCFYGGETKVKINYQDKSCYLTISEVEKINQDYQVSVSEYSQIATGSQVSLPEEFVSIKNLQGQTATGVNYEIVYCTSFDDFSNYQTTTSANGAMVNGGSPSSVGFYKAFIKINGDRNYNEVVSNVVDFAIIDENQISLCASDTETTFGWRDLSDKSLFIPTESDPLNPNYIEFDIVTVDNKKLINYSSTFAGKGLAMIFSDHITLVSNNEKTQILQKNNKILINNGEISLVKWEVPAYLGIYQMTISSGTASEYNINLKEEDKLCKLKIYYDETAKDGKIYFELNCVWTLPQSDSDLYSYETYKGYVVYAIGQDGKGSLTFNVLMSGDTVMLFKVNNIIPNEEISKISVEYNYENLQLSNGEYLKIA